MKVFESQGTSPGAIADQSRLRIALATDKDRELIYRMRHDIYASELAQHPENSEGKLSDALDTFNIYITASIKGEIVGFISVTPPSQQSYSIDKYVSRNLLPFLFDNGLYEIRLLSVLKPYRGQWIALLLMYAAFRWVEAQGGTRIVAIGRREILELYIKVGLESLGLTIQSGAVTFEALSATLSKLQEWVTSNTPLLHKIETSIDWRLDIPFHKQAACFHGGAFFNAIGDEFNSLNRRKEIINADVLDAWYSPSPKVLDALQEHLPWLLRTSPPTGCEGMVKTIARVRGVDAACILPGAGSSDLIFLALRQWLSPSSHVLILDPMYGEYTHVLERVVRCKVDRLPLSRSNGYLLDPQSLQAYFHNAYDLIIIVNPNNPTGRHVPRAELESVLRQSPSRTRIWVDEAYLEYTGSDQSLEQFAARSKNIIVCKSMSKVYALSGLRVGYLCASPSIIEELRRLTPPWAVSLPAQVAAVMAIQDPEYYVERYKETHALRTSLVEKLMLVDGMEVIPSVANFLLCHLPEDGPDAQTVINRCQEHGLFLRNASEMGSLLGKHAIRIAVKDAETNDKIIAILRCTGIPWTPHLIQVGAKSTE